MWRPNPTHVSINSSMKDALEALTWEKLNFKSIAGGGCKFE